MLFSGGAAMNKTVLNEKKPRKKNSLTFRVYMFRMCFRILLFLFVVYIYFQRKPLLSSFTEIGFVGFFSTFGLMQLIWIVLMAGMVLQLLPVSSITMSGKKCFAAHYLEPEEKYDKAELYRFVHIMNIKAWQVMLIWLLFNCVFGFLYLVEIIGSSEMVLLTLFYYCADLICVMIFCPFQTFVLKNRCCVNCRIFDWGHFMMYTPMLFIKSWFSWSLFFTSCIVLIRWEFLFASHPERFWHGSNTNLRCENCKDRLCKIKTPLNEIYRHIQEDISGYFRKKKN